MSMSNEETPFMIVAWYVHPGTTATSDNHQALTRFKRLPNVVWGCLGT